jgi:hypothetical protein
MNSTYSEWARAAVAAMLERVIRATAEEYARRAAELRPKQ